MKNFISAKDVDDIQGLINLSLQFKKNPYSHQNLGFNKRVGLLFLNPSLRTRLSTTIAAQNLGYQPIFLNLNNDGWSLEFEEETIMNGHSVEHIKEAAPIFSQYFDIIGIRTFPKLQDQKEDYGELILNQFLKYVNIPILSLESATLHPLQSLADCITIQENYNLEHKKPKVVLTWAPHIKPLPQCVPNSFAQWMNTWGKVDFTITHPEGLELINEFSGAANIEYDPKKALENADFIYVKNWSSYKDYGKLPAGLDHWMLSENDLKHAPNAKIMHCLPVRRNVELPSELLDGKRSLIQSQAGNRIWAAQAVIHQLSI